MHYKITLPTNMQFFHCHFFKNITPSFFSKTATAKQYLFSSIYTLESHQASQVIVAVWIFFPEADGVPVALLCFFKFLQAVLNYTQIHPSSSKIRPAEIKKCNTISRGFFKLFSAGTSEMKLSSVCSECCIPLC